MNKNMALATFTDTVSALYRLATFRMPKPELNTSMGKLVQETAARLPNATMIVTDTETWTWGEFNERANQIARALKLVGVKKQDCVAVCLENTPEFLAVVVGAAKVGAVSALVSTKIGGATLLHSLDCVSAGLIVVGAESLDSLAEVHDQLDKCLQERVYFVRERGGQEFLSRALSLDEIADKQSVSNLPETQDLYLFDTAYYIYTSGTTGGLPKAVITPHFFWYRASYSFSHLLLQSKQSDRIFVSLPLFHTAAMLIGFGVCAQSGCSMYLARTFSSSRCLQDARRHETNVFLYIGELCRYLLNTERQADDTVNPFEKIVGNGLRPEIWGEFCDRFSIRRVCEYYGSTEGTTAFMNIFNRRNTIGMCLSKHDLVAYDQDNDVEIRGTDGRCRKVVPGTPGLLVTPMTEKSKFSGYTSLTETKRKLLSDVFSEGDSYFNSGDLLCRIRAPWTFGIPHYQFVDRVGETFRWKGENTSTTHVAEVLNALEGVETSCVYGVRVPNTDGRAGMAALQGAANEINLETVIESLRDQLPAASWPLFLRVVSEFEYTPTHKIKKATLKAEGFDIEVISDPVFVLQDDLTTYEPVTKDILLAIRHGMRRF